MPAVETLDGTLEVEALEDLFVDVHDALAFWTTWASDTTLSSFIRPTTLRSYLVDELGLREAPIVDVDRGRSRWSRFRPDLIDALGLSLGMR